MSKLKTLISAGILVASGVFSTSTPATDNKEPVKKETHTANISQKRTAQKIYHRFEDIPEISDEEAALYQKDEYTYIINAERYQQTGEIELKRVLTDEVTKANTLGLIYRSECGTYSPKESEDQIVCYDVDMKLINPTGTYKGPSQMNDEAIALFARYLAANPETRKYVLPLINFVPNTKLKKQLTEEMAEKNIDKNKMLDFALSKLEKLSFDDNGTMRPMDERNNILHDDLFKSIRIDGNNWEKVASPKLKAYINKESRKRKNGLSNAAKNFFCLTETFPSEKEAQEALESYNLTSFPLGRKGKPKQILMALALSMNLKDADGNLDATRIPTYAVAAAVSTINWHGNGGNALSQAGNREMRAAFRSSWKKGIAHLKAITKQWVCGKSRSFGINELSKLNMITPLLIKQYRQIELAGAENLARNYLQEVAKEEAKIIRTTNLAKMIILQNQKQR